MNDVPTPVEGRLPQQPPEACDDAVTDAPLRVGVIVRDGASVVTAFGEVDLATVPQLEAALQRAVDSRSPVIAVDLTKVTFFGVIGVAALERAGRRLPQGSRLQVVTADRLTIQMIRLTDGDGDSNRGFCRHFSTRTAALAAA